MAAEPPQQAGPATPDRPLRRDAERNRLRILDAARALFAERGVHVTLDDIAARAQVGVGTVYRRFTDRNALVDALFAQRLDELVAVAHEALALSDGWAGLTHLFERQLQMQVDDRAFADVLFSDDAGAANVAAARERLAPLVAELLARAQAQGSVRPEVEVGDFPVINLMLMTMVAATRDVQPDAWRRYLTLALEGLRTGERAPIPPGAPTMDQAERVLQAGLQRR